MGEGSLGDSAKSLALTACFSEEPPGWAPLTHPEVSSLRFLLDAAWLKLMAGCPVLGPRTARGRKDDGT